MWLSNSACWAVPDGDFHRAQPIECDQSHRCDCATLYAHFATGTAHLEGQEDSPGANHINAWRIAYEIEHVRDWLFRLAKV